MKIAKRIDKIELVKKFLEKKGLDENLWYDLCQFADFECKYDVVILQKIEEINSEIRVLKQQSKEIGAKLKSIRNNGNVNGWLYKLICKKHEDVISSMRNSVSHKARLVKVLNEMTNEANAGYYSNKYYGI